jgi:uncharacterized protein
MFNLTDDMAINDAKYIQLVSYIKELKSVAVAFSGGVDSTFLLAVATEALGSNAVGITIDSPALPRYELDDAVKLAQQIGAKHIIMHSDDIDAKVKSNPVDRCYFCKKIEFASVKEEAARLGFRYILDGSNADDTKDFRPGMQASKELQVLSPLMELGITKDEIRAYSKSLGLPTWDKPAYACLFSRIPYGTEIKQEDLAKIEKSEKFLIEKGFRTVRVRCHGDLARIEVSVNERAMLLVEPLCTEITSTLKSFGFKFVTIDIQGYRMGSFNETHRN